jgi:quinol monooxygenase YgiN
MIKAIIERLLKEGKNL